MFEFEHNRAKSSDATSEESKVMLFVEVKGGDPEVMIILVFLISSIRSRRIEFVRTAASPTTVQQSIEERMSRFRF